MKEKKQKGDNEWNKKILGNKKVLGKIISSLMSGGENVFPVNTIKSAIKGKSRLLYCQVLVPPASCKIFIFSSTNIFFSTYEFIREENDKTTSLNRGIFYS